MFIFGVLIPAAITVIIFVGFLICWYKIQREEKIIEEEKETKD